MQKQLLLTHLCLPGASLCDFYSWLMQYFKISNSQEVFGTGWCFWTLTVGRLILISQLTRTAPHNIIYIKQGLISIRALLWTFRLFSLYLLWARQNTWISLTSEWWKADTAAFSSGWFSLGFCRELMCWHAKQLHICISAGILSQVLLAFWNQLSQVSPPASSLAQFQCCSISHLCFVL